MQSMGTVNLLSSQVGTTEGNDKLRRRNVHGVLNVASWGIMMPIALIARYLKGFKSAAPAWFYLHVTCQSIAYIVGVTGWGTGLKLGSESASIVYNAHRTIGIVLFCLGKLQEWSCPEAGEVLKRYVVPDWPLLATYLISEASLKQSSRWCNYVSALPRQPYSLLYWTCEELDRYLEASQIRERAIERITNVIGTYNDLRLRIFSENPYLFPKEVYNLDTFMWSFGILFSRLVRLPSTHGKVALVPWADMMNHSCEVDTFLDYDKSSLGVVFTTDRLYQPGEQVLRRRLRDIRTGELRALKIFRNLFK